MPGVAYQHCRLFYWSSHASSIYRDLRLASQYNFSDCVLLIISKLVWAYTPATGWYTRQSPQPNRRKAEGEKRPRTFFCFFCLQAKRPLHTGVRTGCHYFCLSVCVSVCLCMCNIRRLYRLRELYEADFHKPGIYGGTPKVLPAYP